MYAPYENAEGYVYVDENYNPIYFTPEGDWSVSEELRYCAAFQLQESSCLPTPASFVEDDQGNSVYQFNQKGLDAFKEELTKGRPVSISFYADDSQPGQANPAEYINLDTYAQYTYEFRDVDHSVTIVGYDDGYSASNFAHDDAPLPPGDGAFIVKNSWGSANGDFPNVGDWGVDGTGYFYLSYYDQSISSAQTYDFFTAADANDPNYLSPDELFYAHQYSYMPISEYRNQSLFTSDVTKYANVFNAADERLRSVACETTYDDAEVTYQIYLLNDNATDPEDGQLLSTVTETYRYAGFHRAAIPDGIYLKDGQRFSVVVTQKQGDQYVESDRVCLQSDEEREHLSIVGVVNPGESFFYSLANYVAGEDSSLWIDYAIRVADLIAAYDEASPGFKAAVDNPAIRAYGDPISYLIDVVGKLEEDAIAQLEDAGYVPQKVGEVFSNLFAAGTVVQTDPSAGSYLIPGSIVQYLISLGAEPAPVVPDADTNPAAANDDSSQQVAYASENTLPATSDSAADATAALLISALASLGVAVVATSKTTRRACFGESAR